MNAPAAITLLAVFCTAIFLACQIPVHEQTQTSKPTPVVDMRGLPDDAIIEETLSNNWKVVRIKGARFLFRRDNNGNVTLAPLPEQPAN